jgi:predicted ATP-grasp superfamily ATP-dependent carboligase
MLRQPSADMRVLITDGNDRAALATARSLVLAGHTVCVTAATPRSLAGVSRGVRARVITTDPLTNPAGYAAAVRCVAEQEGTTLLLPITDASLEAVLERRALLPAHITLPFADLATYRAASDKAYVLEQAQSCGFGVPETRIVASSEQWDELIPDRFFPGVIKPHRSVVTAGNSRRKLVVTRVADACECRRVLAALPPEAFPVLVQRWVSGVGEGLFALRWGGRTIALFAHRRLREKPLAGGVSVYRESIALDNRLVGPGLRLLDALGWQGVAMIECRHDLETGDYVVMEVNGRFWGSLQLAIDAGVDFPALLVRCAMGERVPECRDYRSGVRSRWFWGDVDHFYLRFRDEPKWRAARDFLGSFLRRHRSEVWRWSDPLPFAVETLQWFGAAFTPGTGDATSRSTAMPTESVPDSACR